MKKWKSILGILTIFYLPLAGCQEDEETPRETLILGTWNLGEQYIEQVTVSSGNNELIFSEEEFIQYLAISGEDIDVDKIRLFSDNTSFSFNEDYTYSIENPGSTEAIFGDWNLNDNQQELTLQVGSESLAFSILSITRNQMQANLTLDEIDDGTRYQINFIFTFTK